MNLIDFHKLNHSRKNLEILENMVRLEEDSGLNTGGQDAQMGLVEGTDVLAAIWCEDGGGFFTIAVRPENQGQGLSRKLLESFIKIAKQRGWEFLIADAVHPATRHLVESLGFSPRESSSVEWFLSLE